MSSIRTKTNGDVTVVYLTEGQLLDESNVNALDQELLKVARKATGGTLVLNFADIHVMSSTVLGKLLLLRKACQQDKIDMKICCLSPSLMDVFKVTNMGKFIEIYPDEAAAISAARRAAVYGRAAALFDREEIERRKASNENTYTTKEVLDYLKTLESK